MSGPLDQSLIANSHGVTQAGVTPNAGLFPAALSLVDFSADRQRRRRPCMNQEGRYQCSFCHYRTDYQTNLIAHRRTHTGERPFRCNFCAKGFAQKSNLKSHMKRHMTDAVAR
nr:putative transcription factor Ovo-like 1 [Rhipicephalus microplus]